MATAAERQLGKAVAQAVQHKFQLLPKTGKNQPHEYTVLAGIVAYRTPEQPAAWDAVVAQQQSKCTTSSLSINTKSVNCSSSSSSDSASAQLQVIALGTGTKCLGASKRSPTCDVINDSHAEVVTRRAFVAWVHHQLLLAAEQHARQRQHDNQHQPGHQGALQQEYQGCSHHHQQLKHDSNQSSASAFYWCPMCFKFVLHSDIKFALYVSQPPCGDASIHGLSQQQQQLAPLSGGSRGIKGQSKHFASCSTGSAAMHKATELHSTLQPGNIQKPVQSQQQVQQQHAAAGRTGAKLIRLAGVADVGEAAAAPDRQPSDPAAMTAGDPRTPTPQAQQQHNNPNTQQGGGLHKQCMGPTVPCASDVETGPQQLGVLRRKPGKGDPTLSLSCSDKIARWVCLGMQGCLLSSCLAEPLALSLLVVSVPPRATGPVAAAAAQIMPALAAACLTGVAKAAASTTEAAAACPPAAETPGSSVTTAAAGLPMTAAVAASASVKQDTHLHQTASMELLAAAEAAGRRAFAGRLAACADSLQYPFALQPPVVVAVQPADSQLGLYPDDRRTSPSGVSINWTCQIPLLAAMARTKAMVSAAAAAGVHEVTLAAHGRKAGAGRKAPNWSNKKTQSRLCSAAIHQQWQALVAAVPELQLQLRSVTVGVDNPNARIGTASAEGKLPQQPHSEQGAADLDITTYKALKTTVGKRYQQAWNTLRQTSIFSGWLVKP